jgi:hypothetical protein
LLSTGDVEKGAAGIDRNEGPCERYESSSEDKAGCGRKARPMEGRAERIEFAILIGRRLGKQPSVSKINYNAKSL